MTMQNILIGLDCGDTCQTVFDQAVSLAQATQAKIHLLSVLVPENDSSITFSPYSDDDWTTYAESYREIETARLKLLESFADTAKEAGIATEFTQYVGSPGSVICKLAKTWKADLIIVGSHQRRGLSEMLLGSVSNYVVHHAPCSVMVVHGQT
ncbi:MAG: universal stress protein [Cyanobacteria bacterium J06633_2]